jgi:hypothetical protein
MSYNSIYTQNIKTRTPSDAKGLEKIILTFSFSVVDITNYLNTLFYGKPKKANNSNKKYSNPLDLGLIPLLDILLSIDFCQILQYVTNKLAGLNIAQGNKFDPQNQPQDFFSKIKWIFQKTAFNVQTEIDAFYNDFDELNSEQSRIGALRLITKIRNSFSSFTQAFSAQSGTTRLAPLDPDIALLIDSFPQLKNIGNYINDTLSYFDRFSDFRQLNNEDIERLSDTIKKIRQYCIVIQSLNSPVAGITNVALNTFNEQITEALKEIDIEKIIPTLKKINITLNKAITICNNINRIIRFSSLMIRSFTAIIFSFKVIIRFFKSTPIPNVYTTVGLTNTASDALSEIKRRGPNTLEVRLYQLSTLMNSVTLFIDTILPIINEVIQKTTSLINNIQRCENAPKGILDDLASTNNQLQGVANSFQSFINNKKQNDLTSPNTQLGEYTIQIIEEEVIEEVFTLRRRYGVALDNRGIVVVRSDSTFASDDSVIINEVKLILRQKGFVVEKDELYTESELDLLREANSYLTNDNVDYLLSTKEYDMMGEEQKEMLDYLKTTSQAKEIRDKARKALKNNRSTLNNIFLNNSNTKQNEDSDDSTKSQENRYKVKAIPFGHLNIPSREVEVLAKTEKDAKSLVKNQLDPTTKIYVNYTAKKIN